MPRRIRPYIEAINEIESGKITCNFCLGEYNYIKNTFCNCNYYYHPECFLKWVESSKKTKCIMCYKNVDINPLLDNNKLEFLNINFNEASDSIIRQRIDNYIFNIDLDLTTFSPIELYTLIIQNVNLPNRAFVCT